MSDLEIDIKNWAEEVIKYYSTKISVLILDKEDAINQCIDYAFNKIPKYEDGIAEGKKTNPKRFFTTVMCCFIINNFKRKRQ